MTISYLLSLPTPQIEGLAIEDRTVARDDIQNKDPVLIGPQNGFALQIRDGRVEAIRELPKGKLTRRPDLEVRGLPLNDYPGSSNKEKAQAELRDIGRRQAEAIKNNPMARNIHVHVSKEAFDLIVSTLNDRSHVTQDDQLKALNRLMAPEREREDSSERRDLGGDRRREDRTGPLDRHTADDSSLRSPSRARLSLDERQERVTLDVRTPAGAPNRGRG